MATNITTPTTFVAATGTGKTMIPYRLLGDQAEFVEDGASGIPARINYKRTEPKPTKDYAGAARGEAKYTEWAADSSGKMWPLVYTASSSLPAFLTDAAKAAFVSRATMVVGLTASQDALAKKVIPQ